MTDSSASAPDYSAVHSATQVRRPANAPARKLESYRYGVFLRPDPITCATEVRIHAVLKQQYGFVSCPVFPPHATLAGSIRIVDDESKASDVVNQALAGTKPFIVHNAGPARLGAGIVYDVHYLPDGSTNDTITNLAITMNSVLEPLSTPVQDYLVSPFEPARFHAHLSLAAFELALKPELVDEVLRFIDGLGEEPPRRFTADSIAMYRFHSQNWDGPWWQTMTWEHIRSWRLGIDT